MKGRIQETFRRLGAEKRKAFIPYIMTGDPDLRTTESHIMTLQECGADIIELGVPFSDPLADGPTIQRAAERALSGGTTLATVLSFVSDVRGKTRVPLVLMTYYNPVFKYGEKRFVNDAVRAGADGVIIPDLPPDEADSFMSIAHPGGLDTIFLLAPTSTPDRVNLVSKRSRGFVYYVSMTGITGSRLSLDSSIKHMIHTIRKTSKMPVAVGFGVSTPAEAKKVAGVADGVIVGSAIVRTAHEDPANLRPYLKALRKAI